MKKLIIVAMIAACVALCAAVWPHGNAVEETPVPAAETTVSAREATVGEIEEPAALAEKEKGRFRSKKHPKRNVLNQRQSLLKCPQILNSSLPQSSHPLKIPHQSQLHPNRLKKCSPVRKSVWRVSAGWSTRGQTTVKMVRIFTKTATKLGSRGEMCSCPLHSLPIRVIMITLNCCTVLNFDRSYHESTNHIERQ